MESHSSWKKFGGTLTDRLFQPVSIQSLAFFRIILGFLGFAHVLSFWIGYHLWEDAYNPDRFQFRYIGFEWLPSFHDPWMSMLMLSIAAAGLLVAAGRFYRPASIYLALGFTYIFLLEKATYLNHAYLYIWVAFLMPFFPADREYSMRVRRNPTSRITAIPYLPIFLLRFLMGAVYFFGGVAKINPDWLRAIPLKQWLAYKEDFFLIGTVLQQEWTPWFMAYSGLLLDLSAPFLLLNRRTRPWIFGIILAFHAINAMVFQIGIFPVMSIALTALFFPPDFPSRAWQWFRKLMNKDPLSAIKHSSDKKWQPTAGYRNFLLTLTVFVLVVHIALPLRHHLFPGDVVYTEEGHRYSWRMMLRTKSGWGHFEVHDPATGFSETVLPARHLWSKQNIKMKTHPDMIWQFAQYLRSEYEDLYPEIEIYAKIKVRVNDYPAQTYIDPGRDLGRERWSHWKHSDWICEQEFERSWRKLLH